MMKLIKSQSRSLRIGADRLTWKSFRAGHATHLAVMGAEIQVIMLAGEWKSKSYISYVDNDTFDAEVFLNTTSEVSDMEDTEDPS